MMKSWQRAALAVEGLQGDAAQVFAHTAAGGIARAGAVAVVVVVLRAPAEDGGEGKEYGERGQPQHGAGVFAVAQREKQRQQQRESRALQAGGGDAVAQAAFEDGRLFAGGGGMLTIPALSLAGLPTDAALATNKLQGSCGTLLATSYFVKRRQMQFRRLLPGIIACAIGAACGTLTVQFLPKDLLQKGLPLLLVAVALLFLFMPALGTVVHQARLSFAGFVAAAALPIGFYDGFLGPGTGSFFMLALISLRGYTLQQATIEAKAYNATTNLVSLLVFLAGGKVVWTAGLAMAVGQLLGARLAAGLVISKGNRLIRPAVITMSLIMSAVLAYRYWF